MDTTMNENMNDAELESAINAQEADNDALRHPWSIGFVLSNGRQHVGHGQAERKIFSSGSVGYYSASKFEFGGKRYQTSVQLVEIGSKPK